MGLAGLEWSTDSCARRARRAPGPRRDHARASSAAPPSSRAERTAGSRGHGLRRGGIAPPASATAAATRRHKPPPASSGAAAGRARPRGAGRARGRRGGHRSRGPRGHQQRPSGGPFSGAQGARQGILAESSGGMPIRRRAASGTRAPLRPARPLRVPRASGRFVGARHRRDRSARLGGHPPGRPSRDQASSSAGARRAAAMRASRTPFVAPQPRRARTFRRTSG